MRYLLALPLVICLCNPSIAQRNIASFSSITETQALGDKVFFTAHNYDFGAELYVSDGTRGNYQLVKDINPGPGGSSPSQLTVLNDELFFVAHSSKWGQSVWKTDGTTEGTHLVYGVPHANPYNLIVFKGKLYFSTNLGSIIQTDGTPEGTKVFYQASFTYGRIMTVLRSENYLYFTENGKTIYRDNGVSRQSFLGPLSWEDVYFKHLFAVENSLIAIKSSTYDNVIRIYSLSEDLMGNSEDDEWVLIKKLDAPLYGDQEIDNFTVASGKLFFSFRTDYDNIEPADELWVSDGTESGTNPIKSFRWDPHWSQSEMGMFFEFRGKIYFRSGNPGAKSLWTSDGTTEGTTKLHDVIITPPYNDENIPVFADSEVFYFSGDTGTGNAELWRSDGTITEQFLDIQDSGGSTPHLITGSDGVVYFVTSSQFSARLWSTLPAPDISVSGRWGSTFESGATPMLFYGTSIGACTSEELIIRNKGLEELYLRSIFITGKDFSLKQQAIPEILKPGESVTLEIVFNPVKEGVSRATLTILSNDEDESNYVLHLTGTPTTTPTEICAFTTEDVKALTPEEAAKAFALTNSSLIEGQAKGTSIGEFLLPGGASASYSFSSGEGDSDNQDFFIEGNLLKANKVFNYAIRNLYSIRVQALSEAGTYEASFRISIVNQSLPTGSADCAERIEKLNFSYKSLEFNSLGQLFATTSNGRILRSADDGRTWNVVYSSAYANLGDIIFKGTTGFVQTSSYILKSDDNGASWFPLYAGLTGQYYLNTQAIFFLSAQTGYVGTEEGEVFFTNDGGQNWEIRFDDNGYREFRDLFFLSEEKGYGIIGFGDLVRTEDGGRSWTGVDLSDMGWGTRARDILFINDDVGFLCTDNKFYKTSNGGRTWFDVPVVFSGETQRIKFYDDKIGYLYGGYNSYALYKTTNGGETWSRILPEGATGALNGVAATPDKLFVTHHSYYSDDRSRSLQASYDEGETWSIRDYYRGEYIRQIIFSSDNNAIAIGQHEALETKDRGQTWQRATLGLSDVDNVYFVDANTMIILQGGDIYKSTDAGATVRKVLETEQSDPYRPAGKIYGFKDDILFSAGWYAVYQSLDKGETWTLVPTDNEYYISDMQFISSSVGYRIELFGSVDKTTDGGLTWTNIYTREPNASDAFRAIFFVNENIAYSGGEYLRKTTDGGVTWETIDWPLSNIMTIRFEDENHGYVVAGRGEVFETKDGGSTWASIFSTGTENLFSAQFINNRIYLVGENGLLAGTSASNAPGIPGYINGPAEICAGDAVQYKIVSGNYLTQWSTTGVNVEDESGYFVVRFPETGEYTISAKHVNSCGSGPARTRTVKVTGPVTKPIIEGSNPAMAGGLDVEYTVTNQAVTTEFIWQIQGSSAVDIDGNTVVVDWAANASQGKITVLAVSQAGCRADGSLDVELQVPVGIESELQNQISLYPNPTEGEVNIHSSHNRPLLVRIVDTMGREHSRLEVAASQRQTLPTRQLASGLYMVEFTDGIQTVTKKLIKR